MAFSDLRVYVGTYRKYNTGGLSGAWLRLDDYKDYEDFLYACHKLHADEYDEFYDEFEGELMFQDWEYIPEGCISESWIDESLWGLWDFFNWDVLEAWLKEFDYPGDKRSLAEKAAQCEEEYCGEYASEEEYVEEHFEEIYDVPEAIACYIDYDAVARDWFRYGEHFWIDGYVFCHR